MKYIFLLVAGLSLFVSCRFIGGKRIRGNGEAVTDSRKPGNFEGVQSFGSFDVVVSTANEYTVTVEADQNLQQYITTEVEDGDLKISTRHGYSLRPRTHIKIRVTAPAYSQLSAHGSGNINSDNLITSKNKLDIAIYGSGNINLDVEAASVESEIAGSGGIFLKGRTRNFKSGIHGSGSIKAFDLKTEASDVEIAGSGNIEVTATNTLNVNIMGSGGVAYKGDAAIDSHIAGSGSVHKVN